MQTENSSLSISLFTSQVDLTELSRGCLDERSRREVSGAASYLGDPNLASRFCPAWCFVDLDGENHNARRTAASNSRQRTHDQNRCCICPHNPTAGLDLDRSSGALGTRKTGSRIRQSANTRGADPVIRPSRVMSSASNVLVRPDAQRAFCPPALDEKYRALAGTFPVSIQ